MVFLGEVLCINISQYSGILQQFMFNAYLGANHWVSEVLEPYQTSTKSNQNSYLKVMMILCSTLKGIHDKRKPGSLAGQSFEAERSISSTRCGAHGLVGSMATG